MSDKHEFSTAERGLGVGIMFLGALTGAAACGGASEGQTQATPEPTAAGSQIFNGIVVNARDHRGFNVGVITYDGPRSKREVGLWLGGLQLGTDCVTPGRYREDPDVPEGAPATKSHNWFRIVVDPDGARINPEWIGDGYFHVQTPGNVPQCTDAQIAGK